MQPAALFPFISTPDLPAYVNIILNTFAVFSVDASGFTAN
jgi:hypothetical protein